MKKLRKKIIAATIGIVAIIVLGGALSIYVIGEPVDGAQVYCTTSVNGQRLELRVETSESAAAFRGWDFEQTDDTLSIRARKVLVSPFFSEGTYQTTIDIEGIETITLGGKMIWSRADSQQ